MDKKSTKTPRQKRGNNVINANGWESNTKPRKKTELRDNPVFDPVRAILPPVLLKPKSAIEIEIETFSKYAGSCKMRPKTNPLSTSTVSVRRKKASPIREPKLDGSIKNKLMIAPKNYTIRPIIPARKKELISVAKAMHREAFAPRVKLLFQPETDAALSAIESGVYVGWRCLEFTWDCVRLGSDSRCFCDHSLQEHESFVNKKGKNKQNLKCFRCPCKVFNFIPQRPDDIGEWWLQKRPGFDVTTWRAKCRCKHTHVQHNPETRRCRIRGCACFIFESNFLCAACDKHLEEHGTFFDDSNSRRQKGLPYGQNYLPFNELPDLRNICLSGSPTNSIQYNSIAEGPFAIPPPSRVHRGFR